MKPFMDADFLLQTDTAKTLYHEAAEKMLIFDYHNHLNPQEILEDRQMAQSDSEPACVASVHHRRSCR